ncbi:MAG TPA: hypothetical protein VFS01_02485 [Rhizomicrobium sp.]|jgi:hypothetical protein|nr:hypothetical protein [Rhizomicrobium sp.]
MEGAALNTPPEMLDRVVRLLIPPAAREAVVGDLWETYRTPSQYAGEAVRTVPYVVFSQMRRYFNLPVLLLQAMLLYACFGPVAAALLLPVLMVADAYQPVSRPTPRRAMRGAVLVAFALVVFLQVAWSSYHSHSPLTVDGVWLGIGLFFVAPCLVPFLCLLRAGLIVSSDRRPTLANREWTAAELARHRMQFLADLRGSQWLEAAVLGGAALWAWRVPELGLLGQMLALFYAAAALFLVLNPPVASSADDFLALRAGYQRDLARHQQLRRFLWWLWCTPALMVLHDNAVMVAGSGRLAGGILHGIAAIMLYFFVSALNRESAGWTQEQIGQLCRMRERLG